MQLDRTTQGVMLGVLTLLEFSPSFVVSIMCMTPRSTGKSQAPKVESDTQQEAGGLACVATPFQWQLLLGLYFQSSMDGMDI